MLWINWWERNLSCRIKKMSFIRGQDNKSIIYRNRMSERKIWSQDIRYKTETKLTGVSLLVAQPGLKERKSQSRWKGTINKESHWISRVSGSFLRWAWIPKLLKTIRTKGLRIMSRNIWRWILYHRNVTGHFKDLCMITFYSTLFV